MKRTPQPSSLPRCWGRGPDKSETCAGCVERLSCKRYAKNRPQALIEVDVLNEELPEYEEAVFVTTGELRARCVKCSGEYGIKSYYAGREAVFESVLRHCKDNGIDPMIWVEAQFSALGHFFKLRGMPVPVNVLIGGKSADRYNQFITDTGKLATGNVRKQAATDVDFSTPEYEYGHAVVVLGLRGETLGHYEKQIKREHPDWNKEDWPAVGKARINAAVSIIDMMLPGASLRVCPPSGPWQWGELSDFLERIAPCR